MKLLPSSVIVISLLSISILTSCDAILDKRKPIDLVCTGVGSDGNPFKKTLTFKPTKRLGTALGALDTDDTDDWSLTFDGDSTYLPVSFKYGDDNKIYELQSVHTVIKYVGLISRVPKNIGAIHLMVKKYLCPKLKLLIT